MRLPPNDFLHSLATFLANAASLAYATTPRALWFNLAQENDAADPYSVLRTYPGSPLMWGSREDRLSIQVETLGSSDGAALNQAQSLFEAFTDGTGYPLRMTIINGFKAADNSADGHYQIVAALPLQRPGLLSRDERGRGSYVFNVELLVLKTA